MIQINALFPQRGSCTSPATRGVCHMYFHRTMASREEGRNIPISSVEEHALHAPRPERATSGNQAGLSLLPPAEARRDSTTHGAATGSLSFRRASQADRAEKSDARSNSLSHPQCTGKHNAAFFQNITSKIQNSSLADRKCRARWRPRRDDRMCSGCQGHPDERSQRNQDRTEATSRPKPMCERIISS